jgi:hypothetical protein
MISRLRFLTIRVANEFTCVLMARKTHREYSAKHISLGHLSKLLYYTWGAIDGLPLASYFTRPAREERDIRAKFMCWSYAVEGLRQGLYHYNPVHHRLAALKSVPPARKAVEYTADYEFLVERGRGLIH